MNFLYETEKEYREFYESMSETKKEISSIMQEIRKFSEIAKTISKADFDLTKYANILKKEDSEKLHLMRENDKLKQLISKERRKHSGTRASRF